METEASILVTGGSGFLGSHVLDELRVRGYRNVIAPRSREYDLTNPRRVASLFADTRPQAVVHLAAVVGGIGANREHPGRFFYENAIMGVELLEQARRAGVRKVVVAGTVCAYPKLCSTPFREQDLWTGYPEETNAPYGLAKKMLLVQAQAYRTEYGFDAIYLLPANLYGPRDSFDPRRSHVIPALIRKCVEAVERGDDAIEVWGTGTATREFLYVRDCARAFVLALERYDGAEPVNVGSGEEISIRDLVSRIAALTGFRGRVVWNGSLPDGQPRRRLDVRRAFEAFGFRAGTSFEQGLRETLDWYREARRQGLERVAACGA